MSVLSPESYAETNSPDKQATAVTAVVASQEHLTSINKPSGLNPTCGCLERSERRA
jgi:hypothetical protein